MRLIIGGAYQGKKNYLRKKYGITSENWTDDVQEASDKMALVDLQDTVKKMLNEGRDPFKEVRVLLQKKCDIIITCDEIGCGVVPIQREERFWRETVGRLCCELAQEAESVERVFCGIAVQIK